MDGIVFKIGDKVKCIYPCHPAITLGEVYTLNEVTEIKEFDSGVGVGSWGFVGLWCASRFVLVSEASNGWDSP